MAPQKQLQVLSPRGDSAARSASKANVSVKDLAARRSLLSTQPSHPASQQEQSSRVLVLEPNSGGEPNPDRYELYLSDLVSARGANFVASRLSPSFSALRQLRVLWLNRNKLRSIEALQGCRNLVELYLDGNEIANLCFLPLCAASLRVLSAANNNIQFLHIQLPVLATFKALTFLTLSGNPIDKEANYRRQVLRCNSNIACLDFVSVEGRLESGSFTSQANARVAAKRVLNAKVSKSATFSPSDETCASGSSSSSSRKGSLNAVSETRTKRLGSSDRQKMPSRSSDAYSFSACERQLLRWADKARRRIAESQVSESLTESLLHSGLTPRPSKRNSLPSSSPGAPRRATAVSLSKRSVQKTGSRQPLLPRSGLLADWQKATLKEALLKSGAPFAKSSTFNFTPPTSSAAQSGGGSVGGPRRRSKRGVAEISPAALLAEAEAVVLPWSVCEHLLKDLQTDQLAIGAVPALASLDEALRELQTRVTSAGLTPASQEGSLHQPASPSPSSSLPSSNPTSSKKTASKPAPPSTPATAVSSQSASVEKMPATSSSEKISPPGCSVRMFFEWLLETPWKKRDPTQLRETAERKYEEARRLHLVAERDGKVPPSRESLDAAIQVGQALKLKAVRLEAMAEAMEENLKRPLVDARVSDRRSAVEGDKRFCSSSDVFFLAPLRNAPSPDAGVVALGILRETSSRLSGICRNAEKKGPKNALSTGNASSAEPKSGNLYESIRSLPST